MPICVVCNEIVVGDLGDHLVSACVPLLEQFGPVGKLKIKGTNGRARPATIADLDRLLADDGTEPKVIKPRQRTKPATERQRAAFRNYNQGQPPA